MKKILLFIFAPVFLTGCPFKNSQSYKNYQTLNHFKMNSFDGKITELVHKKSGARLVLVKNKDPFKTFRVSFRTPPYDDTGLFHIFEHAVLAGSRLHPSKSNFFNVSDSTLASFANAITAPVYTYYPFVTRDPKDFNNLLLVYMDSVFFPNAIKDPRIIKREGWRYEIDPKTKKMSINGIVLSEMKGKLSMPDFNLWVSSRRSLLPQTPYAYMSGGLPEKIAGLKFKQIQQAHKKYYHPQNSLIFLYGDLDFKKTLSTIDESFLSHFTKTPGFKPQEISMQKDFNGPKDPVEVFYPGSKKPNKSFVSKAYLLGEMDFFQKEAGYVMFDAFASNAISPLKLRILKEGLAQSVRVMDLGDYNNGLIFIFEGTEAHKRKRIAKILDEEIANVVSKGLDPELITSVLNNWEFSHKERKTNGRHRGFQLASIVVGNWLFPDFTPALEQHLDTVSLFKKVRGLVKDQGFIKEFFKKNLVENKRNLWTVMKPDPLFSKKFNAKMDQLVKKALKAKPFSEYEKEDKIFRKWVASKEPPEITDKTPLLQISDIKVDEAPILSRKSRIGSTEIIEYPQNANGISYLTLFFDLRGVSEENLKNLKLFTSLLKQTDTANYPFQKLSKQIDTYIGRMDIGTTIYPSVKNPEKFKPTMEVSLSFLNENQKKAMDLLKEILTQSQFSPTDRAKNLLDEMKTQISLSISSLAPSLTGQTAAKDFFPNRGAFIDEYSGSSFLEYILRQKLNPKQLTAQFKTMLGEIFNQKRFYLATLVADKPDLTKLKNKLADLKQFLPATGSKDQKWSFSNQKNYDGYAIAGEVQYLTQAASFKEKGLEYNGAMRVYSNYLDTRFMIPKIREQAGAYGAGSWFSREGLFFMTSYRDPNLKTSFGVFSEAVDFMKNEKIDQKTLKPSILGALGPYYRDRSVSGVTSFMTDLYLRELTWQDYMKTKKEILQTSPESFQRISQVLDQALKKSKKAVSGNPSKIKTQAPFVKNTLSLQ